MIEHREVTPRPRSLGTWHSEKRLYERVMAEISNAVSFQDLLHTRESHFSKCKTFLSASAFNKIREAWMRRALEEQLPSV